MATESKNKSTKKTVTFEPQITLPKSIFGVEKISTQAMFDTILLERATKRQGTHKVKTRAEVSGTGKKPWDQKGTGKARTSSLRTPVFVGGGRAFGPTVERNYTFKVNKKVKKAALVSALTELAKAKAVLVKEFVLETISTKKLNEMLKAENLNDLRYIVLVSSNEIIFKSAKNMPNVEVVKATSLSVEKLVRADALVISEADVNFLEGNIK